MTHRGPFQLLPFCDSVTAKSGLSRAASSTHPARAGALPRSLSNSLTHVTSTAAGRREGKRWGQKHSALLHPLLQTYPMSLSSFLSSTTSTTPVSSLTGRRSLVRVMK